MCRTTVNECDLPEYCSGIKTECTTDIIKENGSPCNDDKAYCWDGICETHDRQCEAIFGSGTKSGDLSCYEEANSHTDRFGNCGFHDGSYVLCRPEHFRCGKIQCVHAMIAPGFVGNGTIIYYTPKQTICKTIDFPRPFSVLHYDVAWVKDGTECGRDKLCVGHHCVSVRSIGAKCFPDVHCNGKGVCNSNGHCHCDIGWSPPNCDSKGEGGSIDSARTAISDADSVFIEEEEFSAGVSSHHVLSHLIMSPCYFLQSWSCCLHAAFSSPGPAA
ncbi:disintegrin and metalloproteinase domain-containing protein 9-like [Rhinatrema bivittatum]|uniref:disintegrin and metalloproteinase domain-containing protein 9-like n=1 Tax=Rhinatrema bivittatum TaxID=194408 RepID=UPI0011296356|nr:disintegrin and metalloproteinase domain-containing protein 9-like [Rhinatrema bivittatum]